EEDFKMKGYNVDTLKEIFTELEFKTLGKRILGDQFNIFSTAPEGVQTDLFGNVTDTVPTVKPKEEIEDETPATGLPAGKNIENTPHHYVAVEGEAAIKELIEKLKGHKEISFDTETTGIDANNCELVGLSFCIKPGEGFYVPCPPDKEATLKIIQFFQPLFDDAGKLWIGQNIKYDLLVMKWYGAEFKGEVFDTMVAHYVIEPEGRRNMDLLSAQFLGYEPVHIEDLIGKKGKNQGTMRDVELDIIKEYAVEDADITLQLKNSFEPLLQKKEVKKVFDEVETPLVKVLTDMEYQGVRVDMEFLNEYSKELEKEALIREKSVYEQAGVRFNLASPKQLGEVLFEKLQLDPKAKKTKGGQYATGEDVLLKLANS